MTLPLELREQIIELAVIPAPSVRYLYIDTKIQLPFQLSPSAVQPAITKVSRQCRSESIPVFYKANIFVVSLLNEGSVRLCQRWIEANKHHFGLMKNICLKVYPSFDGRPLAYDEFRWHAHGPYWLRLYMRPRTASDVVEKKTASEVHYSLGVTEMAGTLAPLWSTKKDGWLLTTVDMVLTAIAKRLDEQGLQLSVDCL